MTAAANDNAATPGRNGKPSEIVLDYKKENNSNLDLKAFKDESSTYAVLSKLCLQLCQTAGTHEPIVHDIRFREYLSDVFEHLIHCVLNHTDRTCRILCLQTLAVTGRSGYGRIRPSALLYSVRETNSTYLEDLIGSDVPTCLANVVLDDPDDGVASVALSSLGLLIMNNNYLFNSIMEDELTLHIQGILGKSIYAPTLRSVTDEDPSIAISELQSRVIENVLSPRLLQILHRVAGFDKQDYMARAIPVLSCALDHLNNVLHNNVDRSTFSKRWPEVDVAGLTKLYETQIVRPLLNSVSGHCAFTAAMASLKLRQVDHVPRILRDEISATSVLETKHVLIATYLVAVRSLPIFDRDLMWLAEEINQLPSTVVSTNSIGILMKDGSRRLPARVTLWTELALQFFLDGPSRGKPEALSEFLEQSWVHEGAKSALVVSDEILYAFTNVAIHTGRKSRATETVDDWVVLAELVLTKFVHPHNVDHMSLRTAGWASYIQLLQEYLNVIDRLQPGESVALKLVSNACPPHILWDNLSSSALYLARSGTRQVRIETQADSILGAWVAKDLNSKKESLNHPMRMFLLSLAGDHWVQNFAANLRNQVKKPLNLASARDMLMALSPKRLLTKLAAEQEPVHKIAVETVRVGVACIENIALTACLWRRYFGSSNETKQIVSTAVGLLQGKIDETPTEEWMVNVMGPICESAVGRIQAFYESAGSNYDQQSFPVSELLTQPVKIKIKPLVSSSSKPSNQTLGDEFRREYLMQACRQMVDSRIQIAIQSNPAIDLLAARPQDPLRLAVPPLPESMDGRVYGFRGEAMSAWGHTVNASSAASDPAQVIAAFTPKRCLRYDGQEQYRISVMIRVFNMTAIDFHDGLRLEYGIADGNYDEDSFTKELMISLNYKSEDLSAEASLVSSSAKYDGILKPGECITWEADLESINVSNSLKLSPSIVFLNLRPEPEDAGAKWVGEKPSESSAVSESQNGEDDFQVTTTDGPNNFEGRNITKENVKLIGDPIVISPLLLFQPCPFVFYTDRCGDADSFRFWWFRFPYHLAPITVFEETMQSFEPNPITRKIAKMSSLTWEGEAIPGGVVTELWAFMSLSGSRVFCVLTETSDRSGQIQLKLCFRGDDRSALHSFVGSKASRRSVVSSLLPGMCSN